MVGFEASTSATALAGQANVERKPGGPGPIRESRGRDARGARPIFLLSMPRSGSTLVQRVLASHPAISTTSEPWLLMPYLLTASSHPYPSKGDWDRTAAGAIEDFCAALPNGVISYQGAVRSFAERLYAQAADTEATYFIDKSPPYSLFLPELSRTFPDARFVVLWRNPLAVVASVIETFSGGKWEPDRYPVSLFASLIALVEETQRCLGQVWCGRFEDLVRGDNAAWSGLHRFLELDFDPSALRDFTGVALNGRLGDPTGVARYSGLSDEPLTKWRRTISTPVRKEWCRRYLQRIGSRRLRWMGYEPEALQAELDSLPTGVSQLSELAADCFHTAGSVARRMIGGSGWVLHRNAGPRRGAASAYLPVQPKEGELANDRS